jgi:RNase P subunit RPR2
MQKRYLEIAKERKKELILLLQKSKDLELKNNCVKQIILISEKYNLPKTKLEKELYCKYCKSSHTSKSKIRTKTIQKNKIKILQKIIICGNCGKQQKIKL